MKATMAMLVEGLETYDLENEQWKSYLRRLYLLGMGYYRREGDPVVLSEVEQQQQPKVMEP